MKVRHFVLIFIGCVSAIGAGLNSSSLVSAQTTDPFHLSVSPPVAYIQVKPGETFTHSVTVHHRGTVPMNVTPQLVDFAPSDQGQGITLSQESTLPYLTAQSQTQVTETFTLEPGQKRTLALAFNPPASALEREYHLTLLFKTQAQTNGNPGIGAEVSGTVGSNMVVLISGGTRNRGQLNLKEVKLPKLVDSLSSLTFTLLAENAGLMATQASGSAIITDWRHQPVAEFDIYPDMVLAHSNRLLRPSQPATSSAETTTNVIPQDEPEFRYKPLFLLGPYTVTIQLSHPGANPEPITHQVLALPFSLLLLALAAGIIYLFSGYLKAKLPIGR